MYDFIRPMYIYFSHIETLAQCLMTSQITSRNEYLIRNDNIGYSS